MICYELVFDFLHSFCNSCFQELGQEFKKSVSLKGDQPDFSMQVLHLSYVAYCGSYVQELPS